MNIIKLKDNNAYIDIDEIVIVDVKDESVYIVMRNKIFYRFDGENDVKIIVDEIEKKVKK